MKYYLLLFLFLFSSFLYSQDSNLEKIENNKIEKLDIYILPFNLVRNHPLSKKKFMRIYDINLFDKRIYSYESKKIKEAILNLEPTEREACDIRLMCKVYFGKVQKIKIYIARHGLIQINEINYLDKENSLLKILLKYFSDYYKPNWLLEK